MQPYASSMMGRILVATVMLLAVACGSSKDQGPPTGTLEQLLAPIALYPDPLLAQILMSAQDSAKVVELDKWIKANQQLKGTQLQDAAVRAGFDSSFVALALFPDVVSKMAEQLAWTRLLGQSFMSDRKAVFAAIQRLRQQAQNVGTLKTSPQQEVSSKTTPSGENVIVIEPANPQVVYVPQYNTETVYTQAPSTTTVIVQEDDNADEAIAAGLIGFTAGIAIGASMNNNYYYGPYGMYGGAYMYNEAWDDYYDAREDAREDWTDHREDMFEERSERLEDRQGQRSERLESTQGQRTERQQNRQENRPQSQAERTERRTQAQSTAAQRQGTAQAQSASRTGRTGSAEARGYGGTQSQAASQRSAGGSDAFSGYSSARSQSASSARGQRSMSSSGSRASRGGGGRRR